MIRPAEISDIPRLHELGQEFHRASSFSKVVQYDYDTVNDLYCSMLLDLNSHLLVLERGGVVVGMAAAQIQSLYFNKHEKVATGLFWYVTPGRRTSREALRLLDELETWAARKGAVVFHMGTMPSSPEGMQSVYARKGYTHIQTSFMKRIEC